MQQDTADTKEYWGEKHNARRRERYNSDEETAERVRMNRRASYARSKGKTVEHPSCIGNLDKIDQTGALMAVTMGTAPHVIGRVFTQTEAAALMDRQAQVIYRWVATGIFPPPVLRDDRNNLYYSDEEVRAFVTIMGEHQKLTPHYRKDHDKVREALFAASYHGSPDKGFAWLAKGGSK